MTTIRGVIENVTSPAADVFIFGLGWKLSSGYIQTVSDDSTSIVELRQAEHELEDLLTNSKIAIRNSVGTEITSGAVHTWLNTADDEGILSPTDIVSSFIDFPVPSGGERWFQWADAITHLEITWPINSDFTILRIELGVEQIDTSRTYGLRMYEHTDLVNPVFETGEVLTTSSRHNGKDIPAFPSPQQFPNSEYLFSCYRVSGSGESTFSKVLMNMSYLRHD